MGTNFFMDDEEARKKNDGSFNSLLGDIVPNNGPMSNPMPVAPASKPVDMSKILSSLPNSSPIGGSDINVGPVQGAELPPAITAAPKRSIVEEYGDLAKSQDEAVKGAQDNADSGNMIANILKGLSGVANADTISRGGKGYDVSNFDKVVDANNARVAAAKAGKEGALGDLLKKYNLGNTEEDRARGDERFKQETVEKGVLNDVNAKAAAMRQVDSPISANLRATAKQALTLQASRAAQLGKRDVAEQLIKQSKELDSLTGDEINKVLQSSGAVDFGTEMKMVHDDRLVAASDKKAANKESKALQDVTLSLAKRYEDDATTKATQVRRSMLAQAEQLAKHKSPANDMSLIYSYMKSNDPGSTVREGEFQMAAQLGSFGDKIQQMVNMARTGQLTDEKRAQILDSVKQNSQAQELMQKATDDHYAQQATAFGIKDPGVILGTKRSQSVAPQGQQAGSKEDQDALDWANANPNDPRAQEIIKLHK